MKLSKNIIISVITIIFLLSALVYNLLYINNKKNEIIEDISFEKEIEEEIETYDEKTICVHIAGAVNTPGLYELKEGARVNDLVIAAGGFLEEADLTEVNLAYILTDAIKVTIPSKKEKSKKTVIISSRIGSKEDISSSIKSSLVNINTANISELKTLNGVGDSTANKIIEYRNTNGSFKSIDELKNVSGIGDVKYAKIKDYVTI